MPTPMPPSRTPLIGRSSGKEPGAKGEMAMVLGGFGAGASMRSFPIVSLARRQQRGHRGDEGFAVDVEALDLGLGTEILDRGLGQLLLQLAGDLVLRLLEARRRLLAPFLDLDHMI